jgi:hypothetical protein
MDLRGSLVSEEINMHVVYVMLALFTLANGTWAVLNWREKKACERSISNVESLQGAAKEQLRKALKLAEESTNEFKVCAECKRIVARHSTDEQGVTTCVNCAAKKVLVNG